MEDNKYLEFEKLLRQYSNLTEEERNTFLVYKTSFFNLINSMSSIPNFMELDNTILLKLIDKKAIESCRRLEKTLKNPNNLFLKYSLFNKVDFSDDSSIINFAKDTYRLIDESFSKIVLDKDLEVYRIVSTDFDDIDSLSRGDLISTTLDKKQTLNFINNDSKRVIFYKIKLSAGTPVIISPYSVVNQYESQVDLILGNDNYVIKVMKSEKNRQKEILLSKKSLEYSINLEKVEMIDNQQFEYYEVTTRVKDNKKS